MLKIFFKKNSLFCFTPEVMLATFLIEIGLAAYVFIRYRLTDFSWLVLFILTLLAGFQFTEYQICANDGGMGWAKAGFVIITLLPVLGLHLISLITGERKFLKFGYALVIAYVLIFLFAPKAITGTTCGGNYVVFLTNQELAWTYSAYYFGFLFLGIWEAVEKYRKSKEKILFWLAAGYGSFLLPMVVVYLLSPAARNAIPSIMCGFALIFALILALKVVPLYFKANPNR